MIILIGYLKDKNDPRFKMWEKDTQHVLDSGRIKAYYGFKDNVKYAIKRDKKQKKIVTDLLKNSDRWVAKYVLKHLKSRKIL